MPIAAAQTLAPALPRTPLRDRARLGARRLAARAAVRRRRGGRSRRSIARRLSARTTPRILIFFVVSAATERRVRFVMYYKYFRLPLLRTIFARCGVIPIASRAECPATYRAAFEAMRRAHDAGEPICLFPEGTVNARALGPIKGGIVKLARQTGASVTPVRISYRPGSGLRRRRARAVVGAPIAGGEVSIESLGAALSGGAAPR